MATEHEQALRLLRNKLSGDFNKQYSTSRSTGIVQEPHLREGGEAGITANRDLTPQKLFDYAHGDQFKNGKYWRGRQAVESGFEDLKKLFTQDDRVGTSIRTIVNSIMGDEPKFNIRLRDSDITSGVLTQVEADSEKEITSEDKQIAQELKDMELPLREWMEDSDAFKAFKKCLYHQQWGRAGYLRIYIPNEHKDRLRGRKPTTLAEALQYIHIHAMHIMESGALTNEHGRTVGYFYLYEELPEDADQKPTRFVELHTPELIEVYERTENGLKLRRDLSAKNPLFDPTRIRDPNYQMYELSRDTSVINQSVIDKQDSLNVAWTNLRRNDDLAGFRTVITVNAEPVKDEEGRRVKWSLTPASVVELKGIGVEDYRGEHIATPTVEVVDPVDPEKFNIPTIRLLVQGILEHFNLDWLLETFRAVSGVSKQESRKAFEKRIKDEEPHVERMVSWAIWTAMMLAASLIGENEKKKYREYYAEGLVFPDVERASLEVFQAEVEAAMQGLASDETVVRANPAVDDHAAELKKIQALKEKLHNERLEQIETQHAARLQRNRGDTNEELGAGEAGEEGDD